jgi:saccharopine dehydrogenase-like NADP-dependent oxidoreductase
MKRIVVIGGTGHFGARLCRRLAGEANTELVVASRSHAGSQSLVEELRRGHPAATIEAARLDQFTAGFAKDLELLRPDIVVHTVGPYQGQDYRVASCCIEVGSHYVDLADGRDFVCGFAALDPDAKRRGVLLVAGASTCRDCPVPWSTRFGTGSIRSTRSSCRSRPLTGRRAERARSPRY